LPDFFFVSSQYSNLYNDLNYLLRSNFANGRELESKKLGHKNVRFLAPFGEYSIALQMFLTQLIAVIMKTFHPFSVGFIRFMFPLFQEDGALLFENCQLFRQNPILKCHSYDSLMIPFD